MRSIFPEASIFPAGGRKNALEESLQLHEWDLDRWACVVDTDLDNELEKFDLGSRLHPYLSADLEAMLITLGVLHDLLEHFGSQDKVTREGGVDSVVPLLRTVVAGVSNLRRKNASEGWGVPFDKIPLEGKIDRRTLQLHVSGYCAALKGAADVSVGLDVLIATIEAGLDDVEHFSGEDVVAAMSVALRSRVGSLSKEQASVAVLLRALRMGGAWRLSKSEWTSQLQSILQA